MLKEFLNNLRDEWMGEPHFDAKEFFISGQVTYINIIACVE